jgi:hypothetical protein
LEEVTKASTYYWLWLQHAKEGEVGWIETEHEKGRLSSQVWHVFPDVIVDLRLVVEVRNGVLAFGDYICSRKCAPDVMLQRWYFSRQLRKHDTLALFNFTSSYLAGAFEESFPPLCYRKDGLSTLFMSDTYQSRGASSK